MDNDIGRTLKVKNKKKLARPWKGWGGAERVQGRESEAPWERSPERICQSETSQNPKQKTRWQLPHESPGRTRQLTQHARSARQSVPSTVSCMGQHLWAVNKASDISPSLSHRQTHTHNSSSRLLSFSPHNSRLWLKHADHNPSHVTDSRVNEALAHKFDVSGRLCGGIVSCGPLLLFMSLFHVGKPRNRRKQGYQKQEGTPSAVSRMQL